MIKVIKDNEILAASGGKQLHMDGENKVMVFERGSLIFIFNFSPQNSIFGYKFWVPKKGNYTIILNSDRGEFGGFNRVDDSIEYATDKDQMLSIYLTNRTALVMKKN